MGSIKDRNGMDLTEAKDIIRKRWQQHIELYKKDLNDSDSRDGVITRLEPDIWSVKSSDLRKHYCKVSGSDRILAELFKILKYDAVKVLHSICQQILKTQQWPWDWKMSAFIPNPKERQCQIIFKLPRNCTLLTHE